MSGYCYALESLGYQFLYIFQITGFAVIGHSAYYEAVGIAFLNVGQIVVLDAVNEFLHHYGCGHLGVVHV